MNIRRFRRCARRCKRRARRVIWACWLPLGFASDLVIWVLEACTPLEPPWSSALGLATVHNLAFAAALRYGVGAAAGGAVRDLIAALRSSEPAAAPSLSVEFSLSSDLSCLLYDVLRCTLLLIILASMLLVRLVTLASVILSMFPWTCGCIVLAHALAF